ncbi:hypothetical protein [Streptomyces longwoodensis]|uniref:hypothetical protein n=1 Tax=Streptomyces longwoodensis TaxID=68231 RepID=UPI002254EA90|nr:hypothetical protein [Streptomyces longwoodensis]MCX4994278.1 hypothetical protein [Streptomyces longwoodensis]
MLAALALCYFVLVALGAIVALALIDFRTVPPVAGTTAFIVTLAALGVAVLR